MKQEKQYGLISRFRVNEGFKGEVTTEEIKFPKALGIAHPFEFAITEELYKRHPFVKGAVDKHVDFIVADFIAKAKNENVQALIDKFIQDTNFNVVVKQWVLSALITGNGFLELDLNNSQVRVLDPKTMYVQRTNKGVIKGYTQYAGNLKNFGTTRNQPIPFTPNQIAHLKYNTVSDEAYGIGIVWPNVRTIDNQIANNKDMHELIHRKAGAPIHVKVGIPGENVNQTAIDKFHEDLVYLTNKTEWVTDANCEMKVLDFGNLGDKFSAVMDSDNQDLYFGFQVPAVLMGIANINEGLANVQMQTWQRRVKSYQEETEKVIEEKIFKPILLNQKNEQFQEHIEIFWSLPGEEEVNKRIQALTTLLSSNILISENMRRIAEIEIANALKLEDAKSFLKKPSMDAEDERREENEIQQPEVPGAKPSAEEKLIVQKAIKQIETKCHECEIIEKDKSEMTLIEWTNLQEGAFKYSDYMVSILKFLKTYDFAQLKAITETDLEIGLLPESDIEKLRQILKNGFRKNLTMREITGNIRTNINLKDRFNIYNGEKVLEVTAQNRPELIARTETLRLANEGLIQTFKDNKVEKVRWLSAVSERTCEICENLNGRVLTNDEYLTERFNIHPNCRCTAIPILE